MKDKEQPQVKNYGIDTEKEQEAKVYGRKTFLKVVDEFFPNTMDEFFHDVAVESFVSCFKSYFQDGQDRLELLRKAANVQN